MKATSGRTATCLAVGSSCLLLLFLIPDASAQKVVTVAGGYIGDGKLATSAALSYSNYATFDAHDNLYVSDSDNCRIRKVDTTGNISTVAGTGICGFSGDGGPGNKAKLSFTAGIAIDPQGNIFFADSGNSRVRKIDPSGTITTVAGKGKAGYCGDGGPAIKACFKFPTALAIAGSGANEVLYIADSSNNRIRRVAMKTGIITTEAGNGQAGYTGDGGPAKKASLRAPQGIAVYSASHTLWVSDSFNGAVRQVDLRTGIITTFTKGAVCNLDVCFPTGIVVDSLGNLHVADLEWVLAISVPDATVTAEAGVDFQGFSGDGHPATSSVLNNPSDVALDSADNLFIVDSGNNRIRKGAGAQTLTTVAGGEVGDGGPAVKSSLNWPEQTAFDQSGNLYIADEFNNRIRKVSVGGKISTFAGTGLTGYTGDGGKATKATLSLPTGVAVDRDGNVFIADQNNWAIRKVDSAGRITTFAGGNGTGILPYVNSLVIDSTGNVYAAATCTVYRITPNREITDFAGGQCGYGGDGGPATQASLSSSVGLAFDPQGSLYIADTYNNRVRLVNLQGIINTVAGNGARGFGGDGGPAVDAMLYLPTGVAPDAKGNFYIADSVNRRIRLVSASGTIDTFAGTGRYGYNGNGLVPLKTNMYPDAVSVSPTGEIYFSDFDSYRVRKVH